jgi:hypothetical protein
MLSHHLLGSIRSVDTSISTYSSSRACRYVYNEQIQTRLLLACCKCPVDRMDYLVPILRSNVLRTRLERELVRITTA